MKNDALCLLYVFALFISDCALRQKPLPVSANTGVAPLRLNLPSASSATL